MYTNLALSGLNMTFLPSPTLAYYYICSTKVFGLLYYLYSTLYPCYESNLLFWLVTITELTSWCKMKKIDQPSNLHYSWKWHLSHWHWHCQDHGWCHRNSLCQVWAHLEAYILPWRQCLSGGSKRHSKSKFGVRKFRVQFQQFDFLPPACLVSLKNWHTSVWLVSLN